ncbi:MAG: hypothetical protein CSA34_08035 [Desulfobulbus propionicus]|nr:MAG: hypothetical protein CSA34_08035 [Desulfobulbus propionicus]
MLVLRVNSMTEEAEKIMQNTQDLRRYKRVDVNSTSVNVTDGYIFCTGQLANISGVGACLKQLPCSLDREAERITVFINDAGFQPVLHLQPVWSEDSVSGKVLGGLIKNTPDNWKQYLGMKS